MNAGDFEETLNQELKNLNIQLLDIYTRRRALCIDWSFDKGRPFTSCFLIQDTYLSEQPEKVLYAMIKNILYGLSHADNIVGEIHKIERPKKK